MLPNFLCYCCYSQHETTYPISNQTNLPTSAANEQMALASFPMITKHRTQPQRLSAKTRVAVVSFWHCKTERIRPYIPHGQTPLLLKETPYMSHLENQTATSWTKKRWQQCCYTLLFIEVYILSHSHFHLFLRPPRLDRFHSEILHSSLDGHHVHADGFPFSALLRRKN